MRKNITKSYIIKELKNNKEKFKAYDIIKIGLFGSYVREEEKKSSDIDILVEFNKGTFDNYMGLKEELESKFDNKIDLVSLKSLKRRIRSYILEEVEWL